jgi:UDP-3-O-[3-hydroxymyristoyl] N-acetylglucosamine deacetylase/3-hydroxyacyl-[acyl-carrier-protein] dehydratase
MKSISDFKTEISESRTFSFLHELESLLENGLIKGGDLNNAIVYVDKEISATMESLKVAFEKMKYCKTKRYFRQPYVALSKRSSKT